jgi:hypothetical protein
MTPDPKGWPTPAESLFASKLLEVFQLDLEKEFPGRGGNIAVHAFLGGSAAMFSVLEDEDDLADILNACLQGQSLPWRLVRIT